MTDDKLAELTFGCRTSHETHITAYFPCMSGRTIALCLSGLSSLFGIPYDAKRVRISIHSQPKKGRFLIYEEKGLNDARWRISGREGDSRYALSRGAERALSYYGELHRRDQFYVEAEVVDD